MMREIPKRQIDDGVIDLDGRGRVIENGGHVIRGKTVVRVSE